MSNTPGKKLWVMAASTPAMPSSRIAHDLSKASLVDPAVDELTDAPMAFPIANPDKPQAACVLLLDTSRSMRGAPIRALQQGLETYRDYLAGDAEAKLIVETCVIAFSDEAKVVHPFSSVDSLPKIELEAGGWTSMGAAIDLGIQQIEERKAFYKDEGVDYYRPFLVLITDGAPTDLKGDARFNECAAKLQQGAKDRKFIPLLFGTGNANFDKLKLLAGPTGTVAGIDGARFEEFFQWLSKSVSGLKDSKPGEVVTFADPTLPTAETPNPFAFEV
ncbi:MAG: hypothetical protein QOC71_1663 [Thermoplasmata archaeon]|nr:hypothetical protein [Thermoplasmata archaeon]